MYGVACGADLERPTDKSWNGQMHTPTLFAPWSNPQALKCKFPNGVQKWHSEGWSLAVHRGWQRNIACNADLQRVPEHCSMAAVGQAQTCAAGGSSNASSSTTSAFRPDLIPSTPCVLETWGPTATSVSTLKSFTAPASGANFVDESVDIAALLASVCFLWVSY